MQIVNQKENSKTVLIVHFTKKLDYFVKCIQLLVHFTKTKPTKRAFDFGLCGKKTKHWTQDKFASRVRLDIGLTRRCILKKP